MTSETSEDHLITRVTKYALEKKLFTLHQLREDLKLDESEFSYVTQSLTQMNARHTENPNHLFVFTKRKQHSTSIDFLADEYMLLPTAYYSYVDHLEIMEARKAAKESKRLSWIAIWISTGIGLLSLIVGLIQIKLAIK